MFLEVPNELDEHFEYFLCIYNASSWVPPGGWHVI